MSATGTATVRGVGTAPTVEAAPAAASTWAALRPAAVRVRTE